MRDHCINYQVVINDKYAKALAVRLAKFSQSFFQFSIEEIQYQLLVWLNIDIQKLLIVYGLYPCCFHQC
mgnify:CR=1 FL=1